MRIRSVSKKTYALWAATIFLAMALYSGIRILQGAHYAGYRHSLIIDGVLVAIWSSAAVAMLVPRGGNVLVALLGLFATLAHAFLSALALGWGALPYFIALALLTLLMRKSMGIFHPAGLFEAEPRA